ncbi:MAG: response regulator [Nannocystaceae bacterium]|nr:response regulator [Nannocystaceae bacterium]
MAHDRPRQAKSTITGGRVTWLARVSDLGVTRVRGHYLKSKIRLCNQVGIFLCVLGALYAGISVVYFPNLAIFPMGAAGAGAAALLLNSRGCHRLSRFVVSVAPVSLDSLYHARLVADGEPIIVPLYLAAVGFSLYPWVLTDLREKKLLVPSVLIGMSWLSGQQWANGYFEAAVDGSAFRTGWLSAATYFFALLISVSCLIFLQHKSLATERERDAALDRLADDYRREQKSREAAEEKGSKLEQQLQQVQRLEAIGRLAGGVAHDLNNLLTPIIGYAELLQQELAEQEIPMEFADGILDASVRAKDLVGQLLAFSRRQTLALGNVDMAELVRRFQPLLRRTIREDVSMIVTTPDSVANIVADARRIEQALMNLCVNAAAAMPDGGELSIEVQHVELDVNYAATHLDCEPGPYILLAVTDSGVGIAPEVLPNIFEPFFSTKGMEGTGLGLATVYGIAKQHRGSVTVYSEVGHGTVFKVYLPVSEETLAPARMSTGEDVAAGGHETILLVEDHDGTRQLAETLLSRLGYQVLLATHGKEALSVVAKGECKIHLLLSDVIMPEMNGRELFAAAKEIAPEVKLLFMSGYTHDVVSRHGALDPGIHLLQKPFTIKGLSHAVRRALDDNDA